DRQRAVNGRARDRVVDRPRVVEELLGGEVLALREGRIENRKTLVGGAKALLGQEFSELFARCRDAHAANVFPVGGTVNVFVSAGPGAAASGGWGRSWQGCELRACHAIGRADESISRNESPCRVRICAWLRGKRATHKTSPRAY